MSDWIFKTETEVGGVIACRELIKNGKLLIRRKSAEKNTHCPESPCFLKNKILGLAGGIKHFVSVYLKDPERLLAFPGLLKTAKEKIRENKRKQKKNKAMKS